MKNDINKNEDGRSMIEMLGVLAIIGVLSVGGIAGYSKAMHRYKVNKTIEQITYMAGSIRSFFAPQKSYNGLGDGEVERKAGLVPDDMWGEEYRKTGGKFGPGRTIVILVNNNVWGGYVNLTPEYRNSYEINQDIYKAFSISYSELSEETCIDLITQDWTNAGVSMITVSTEGLVVDGPGGGSFILPINLDDAARACESLSGGVHDVRFYFDVDVTDSLWKDRIDATTALLNGE